MKKSIFYKFVSYVICIMLLFNTNAMSKPNFQFQNNLSSSYISCLIEALCGCAGKDQVAALYSQEWALNIIRNPQAVALMNLLKENPAMLSEIIKFTPALVDVARKISASIINENNFSEDEILSLIRDQIVKHSYVEQLMKALNLEFLKSEKKSAITTVDHIGKKAIVDKIYQSPRCARVVDSQTGEVLEEKMELKYIANHVERIRETFDFIKELDGFNYPEILGRLRSFYDLIPLDRRPRLYLFFSRHYDLNAFTFNNDRMIALQADLLRDELKFAIALFHELMHFACNYVSEGTDEPALSFQLRPNQNAKIEIYIKSNINESKANLRGGVIVEIPDDVLSFVNEEGWRLDSFNTHQFIRIIQRIIFSTILDKSGKRFDADHNFTKYIQYSATYPDMSTSFTKNILPTNEELFESGVTLQKSGDIVLKDPNDVVKDLDGQLKLIRNKIYIEAENDVNEKDQFVERFQLNVLNTIKMYVSEYGQTNRNFVDYFLRIKKVPAVRNLRQKLMQKDAFDWMLNKFQNMGKKIIKNSRFSMISAPAACGKTKIVCAAAKLIMADRDDNNPVFVISPQNLSANDITKKIFCDPADLPVYRVGNRKKFDQFCIKNCDMPDNFADIENPDVAHQENYRRCLKYNNGNGFNKAVYVGTPMGLIFKYIQMKKDAKFEKQIKNATVIIDEAGLINYPELLVVLYILNPKAVHLVGDVNQNGPMSIKAQLAHYEGVERLNTEEFMNADNRYVTSSLKEMLNLAYNHVRVAINYRNMKDVVEVIQYFYSEIKLIADKNSPSSKDTFRIVDTSDFEEAKHESKYFFIDTENDEVRKSPSNLTEAKIIVDEIYYFLQQKGEDGNLYTTNDILIVTPFLGQIQLIKYFIENDERFSSDEKRGLLDNDRIVTSRSIQGGESKVVLVSMVKSKLNPSVPKDGNKKSIVADPALWLVSLTRAKERMVVVGNQKTLNKIVSNDPSPLVRGMYRHVFEHSKVTKINNFDAYELDELDKFGIELSSELLTDNNGHFKQTDDFFSCAPWNLINYFRHSLRKTRDVFCDTFALERASATLKTRVSIFHFQLDGKPQTLVFYLLKATNGQFSWAVKREDKEKLFSLLPLNQRLFPGKFNKTDILKASSESLELVDNWFFKFKEGYFSCSRRNLYSRLKKTPKKISEVFYEKFSLEKANSSKVNKKQVYVTDGRETYNIDFYLMWENGNVFWAVEDKYKDVILNAMAFPRRAMATPVVKKVFEPESYLNSRKLFVGMESIDTTDAVIDAVEKFELNLKMKQDELNDFFVKYKKFDVNLVRILFKNYYWKFIEILSAIKFDKNTDFEKSVEFSIFRSIMDVNHDANVLDLVDILPVAKFFENFVIDNKNMLAEIFVEPLNLIHVFVSDGSFESKFLNILVNSIYTSLQLKQGGKYSSGIDAFNEDCMIEFMNAEKLIKANVPKRQKFIIYVDSEISKLPDYNIQIYELLYHSVEKYKDNLDIEIMSLDCRDSANRFPELVIALDGLDVDAENIFYFSTSDGLIREDIFVLEASFDALIMKGLKNTVKLFSTFSWLDNVGTVEFKKAFIGAFDSKLPLDKIIHSAA